jgi:hypothetical protein
MLGTLLSLMTDMHVTSLPGSSRGSYRCHRLVILLHSLGRVPVILLLDRCLHTPQRVPVSQHAASTEKQVPVYE